MSKSNKIIIVGPAHPYRGGIAQYNNKLAQAIEDRGSEVAIYSFRRLYPGWLYPGSSDKELSKADQSAYTHETIDVYNPISLFATYRKIRREKPDAVLITWWTLFWQPAMALLAKLLSLAGIRTILICHNLYDHDGSVAKQWIGKKLLSSGDAYIVHSSDEKQALHKIFPRKDVLQRLLPIYDQFPASSNILRRRAPLELLFFGFIRPYKGLDVLLDALALLPDPEKVHLSVVGEYWGEDSELQSMVASRGLLNVELVNRYVSMDEAADYFERADICVLPYITATGSAVLSLAYNFGTPVIASSAGGLKDGVAQGKTGWLVPPSDPESLRQVIENRIPTDKALYRSEIDKFSKENSWGNMADQVTEFATTKNGK